MKKNNGESGLVIADPSVLTRAEVVRDRDGLVGFRFSKDDESKLHIVKGVSAHSDNTGRPKNNRITENQRGQYTRLINNVANEALIKAHLNKDGLQRVIEYSVDIEDELREVVANKIKELSDKDRYRDERVKSNVGYYSGYKPKSIIEQVAILRQLFPGLKDATFNEDIAKKNIPVGAEGWFAIPRYKKIAPTYSKAVWKVITALSEQYKDDFTGYTIREEMENKSDCIHQRSRSLRFWEKIETRQQKGHEILIIPAQFGLRYNGYSVRRARIAMGSLEFGLGAFAIGVMILTHPKRLKHRKDLWIYCAGDDYSQYYGYPFCFTATEVICFDRSLEGDGKFTVEHSRDNMRYKQYGSPSGFLLKNL